MAIDLVVGESTKAFFEPCAEEANTFNVLAMFGVIKSAELTLSIEVTATGFTTTTCLKRYEGSYADESASYDFAPDGRYLGPHLD